MQNYSKLHYVNATSIFFLTGQSLTPPPSSLKFPVGWVHAEQKILGGQSRKLFVFQDSVLTPVNMAMLLLFLALIGHETHACIPAFLIMVNPLGTELQG